MIEYIVQKNDTIAAVKERFKVTWRQIQEQNPNAVGRMRDSGRWFLKEGSSLKFENAASEAETVTFQDHMERSSLREHKVRAGDTLWRLSKTYGVDVESLAALNGLENPDLIRVGQTLSIPGNQDLHQGKEPSDRNLPPSEAIETKDVAQEDDSPTAGSGDQALLDALAGDIMPMPLYTGELSIQGHGTKEATPVGKTDVQDRTPIAEFRNEEAVSLAHEDSREAGIDAPAETRSETSSNRFSISSLREDGSSRNRVRLQYRPTENTKVFLGLDFERYRKSAYVEKEEDLDLSVQVGISLDF